MPVASLALGGCTSASVAVACRAVAGERSRFVAVSAQRDEADGLEQMALEVVPGATHEHELLVAAARDRRDEPAAVGELALERRRRLVARRGGDVDRIER